MRSIAWKLLLMPTLVMMGCAQGVSGSVAGSTLNVNTSVFTLAEGTVACSNAVDVVFLQISSVGSVCADSGNGNSTVVVNSNTTADSNTTGDGNTTGNGNSTGDANTTADSNTNVAGASVFLPGAHKGETLLQLVLAQSEPVSSGAQLTTGVFTAYDYLNAQGYLNIAGSPTSVAYGTYHSWDSNCTDTALGKGEITGGTVTLDSFTDSTSGTATVTFNLRVGPQGDLVTGQVVANYCAGLNPLAANQLTLMTLGDPEKNCTIPAVYPQTFDPSDTYSLQPQYQCQ